MDGWLSATLFQYQYRYLQVKMKLPFSSNVELKIPYSWMVITEVYLHINITTASNVELLGRFPI